MAGQIGGWAAGGILSVVGGSYLAVHLRNGWFPWDAGSLAVTAERVVDGGLPHRDFPDLYTGGLTFLNAAAFRILGVDLLSPANRAAIRFRGLAECSVSPVFALSPKSAVRAGRGPGGCVERSELPGAGPVLVQPVPCHRRTAGDRQVLRWREDRGGPGWPAFVRASPSARRSSECSSRSGPSCSSSSTSRRVRSSDPEASTGYGYSALVLLVRFWPRPGIDSTRIACRWSCSGLQVRGADGCAGVCPGGRGMEAITVERWTSLALSIASSSRRSPSWSECRFHCWFCRFRTS